MRRRLLKSGSEIICCPEACLSLFEEGWHCASSQPDYGYPLVAGRRKVVLWSRWSWENLDDAGSPELPPGRFVSGLTTCSLGRVRVIAVCVPWAATHVSTGNRNRRRWEDHVAYLRGLRSILCNLDNAVPTILLGDINQRIPHRHAPKTVFAELKATLEGFQVWTEGSIPGMQNAPVCHIVGSSHFRCEAIGGFPRHMENGRTLSDHDGIQVDLAHAR
ncbi:MAG: endonuclease/exonuclease/phosphatase family protein [Salinarimonas sp.]|nr:endonuclease/exonuclease/phosphatase family protein [Salinarimonas sp.]